ncbi:CDP-glycerol glycerophosphotransferase family protein [Aliarcobacter butzleri]|uniref:CDP-glycerol glycerophosphotransferase family protein n=1 Tax=Aliarcobacter butzleri TaxID=28197 RepID=UPI001EE029C6|nr:CDP-glycerol glycerophosphotransferase family protein [Aliarcobacter butzleri]MCG3697870.1 CDP-glycerol glycerophosphotransferase family protein [Aliarcobacter butzleri]MDN5080560.1 CDP-glycerol glycerophosphotransferase family protein [Aliarcobacter butzleri]MDN5091583.1 CDP-glycerol glycerophosphotransferase family protein [Aliarcobacter butzleri]
MNIEIFKNKRCYIFPKSNISLTFKKYLEVNGIVFLGFIDNNLKDEEIYSLNDIQNEEFDYIFILSPNHLKAIYEQTIKSIPKEKVVCVSLDSKSLSYAFSNDGNFLIDNLIVEKNRYLDYFNEKLEKYELEDAVLLIGINFLDLNVKYLYLHLKKYTNLKVYISTNNQRDIEIFQNHGIRVVPYFSEEFLDLVFSTKVKIIDHTPTDELLIKCLNIGKSIQLWHGITIETLGVLANYKALKYDIVLSTSPFVSDYSFSKIYLYDKIVHCGYPRNDVLYNNDIELINVDVELLETMQNDEFKYVVYMPTHRPLSFADNPMNYKVLNEFGKKNNIKFIIKMHPFVAEKLRDDLSTYQSSECTLDNIILYPSFMDVYPILKYCDILISDYSSVYFDFLYVNKPILFFCYDYEKWVEGEQGVILDYFAHSPGDKCYTFEDLLYKILVNLKEDKYKEDRKLIFEKMFENHDKKASSLLVQEIEKLL